MAWMHPDWDDVECGQISNLCGNPDTGHGGDDWPRVLILHLSAEEFELFDANPLEYTRDNNLFPDQPLMWMGACAKPPVGIGPQAVLGTPWTVTIIHARPSSGACAAVPDESQFDVDLERAD
jgi:hypothetical protein